MPFKIEMHLLDFSFYTFLLCTDKISMQTYCKIIAQFNYFNLLPRLGILLNRKRCAAATKLARNIQI